MWLLGIFLNDSLSGSRLIIDANIHEIIQICWNVLWYGKTRRCLKYSDNVCLPILNYNKSLALDQAMSICGRKIVLHLVASLTGILTGITEAILQCEVF